MHRHGRTAPTSVDTRIYLPSRMPKNLLLVCKQLREECLTYHSCRLNSHRRATIVDSRLEQQTINEQFAERRNIGSDEALERPHDNDCARITLEVLRPYRDSMGYCIPEKKDPSPRFMALTPLLGRLKRIKFMVWAGYEWWSGESTRPIAKTRRLQKARLSRTSADQDDAVLQPSLWETNDVGAPLVPRPNPLSVAIDALLRFLPLVEEINIDLLMHHSDWWSWDLPDIWWEGIRTWLDGPVSPISEGKVNKIDRRVVLTHYDWHKPATLLEQHELMERDGCVVHIRRGSRKVSKSDVACRDLSDSRSMRGLWTGRSRFLSQRILNARSVCRTSRSDFVVEPRYDISSSVICVIAFVKRDQVGSTERESVEQK